MGPSGPPLCTLSVYASSQVYIQPAKCLDRAGVEDIEESCWGKLAFFSKEKYIVPSVMYSAKL